MATSKKEEKDAPGEPGPGRAKQFTKATGDEAVVQEAIDRATEQGFIGVETDPTPNEHYTVAGVVAGQPTPETDLEHARDVRQQLDTDARSR